MNTKYFLFINGILSRVNDINAWNERAVSWVQEHTKYNADKFHYFSDIIFQRLWQSNRVDKIDEIIGRIHTDKIHLVGHSNGCDLIERFIKKLNGKRRIEELHLIAAASESNFRLNGYNEALKLNKIGKIFIYWSKQDSALKKAKLSKRILGWLRLGYGYLGLVGAKYVSPLVQDRVISKEYHLDHCEYFNEVQFDETLRDVTGRTNV